MPYTFIRIPAFWYLVVASIGYIITEIVYPGDSGYLLDFLSVILISCFALFLCFLAIKYKRLYVLAFLVIGLVSGLIFHYYLWVSVLPIQDSYYQKEKTLVIGEVTKSISETASASKFIVSGLVDAQSLVGIEGASVMILSFDGEQYKVGDRLRVNGNLILPEPNNLPGEFDYTMYLRSMNVIGTVKANKISYDYTGGSDGELLTKVRDLTESRFRSTFANHQFPIIKAMLLGDKSEIDKNIKKDFSLSGTAHILAVSGLHTGIIAVGLFFILSGLRNKYLRLAIFACLLILFVMLSGASPSAIRAAIMSVLFLWTYQSERKANPLNILALAVIFALVFSPSLFFAIGFRMSVLAVLGIVLFYERFYLIIIKIVRMRLIAASLSISFASSMFLSPYIAYIFGNYSIIAPIANLIVVPLFSGALVFAIVGQISDIIVKGMGVFFHSTAELLLDLGLIFNEFLANLGWASVDGSLAQVYSICASILLLAMLNRYGLLPRILIVGYLFFLFEYPKGKEIVSNRFNRRSVYYFEEKSGKDWLPIIIDKYYRSYPELDFGLLRYMSNKVSDGDTILITGMHGMRITDILNKEKQIEVIEIDISRQRQLLQSANINIKTTSSLKKSDG